ncbi:MAG: hypothetical protein HC850_08795 [Rhodomicrobium sp.]|nr:hypothetical protein [Rhodomicrobium sp.]
MREGRLQYLYLDASLAVDPHGPSGSRRPPARLLPGAEHGFIAVSVKARGQGPKAASAQARQIGECSAAQASARRKQRYGFQYVGFSRAVMSSKNHRNAV